MILNFEEADATNLMQVKTSDAMDTNGDKNVKKEGKNNNSRHYIKSKPSNRRASSLLDIFRASNSFTTACNSSIGMWLLSKIPSLCPDDVL